MSSFSFIGFIQDVTLTPLILGVLASCFLLFRSLTNFTRTGPRIREEISENFSFFTSKSLARLGLWAFIITFLAALTGAISYALINICWQTSSSFIGYFIASGAAFCAISSYQFCFQLLNIPSSLQASAQFRFSRLIPLWKRLQKTNLMAIKRLSLWLFSGHFIFAFYLSIASSQLEKWFVIAAIVLAYCSGYLLFFHVVKIKPTKPSSSKKKSPNILMIGCDTLRADRLGHYKYKRDLTPFIDSLAREGVLFSNCYTPLARTAPALSSLFTGLWPHNHKIRTNYPEELQLNLPIKTVIQQLNEQGYETTTVGDWSASDLAKINFGFKTTHLPDDQWNIKNFIRQGPAELRLFLTLFTHNKFGKRFLPELYYLAGVPLTHQLAYESKTLISEYSEQDKPFFLNMFAATTHVPFGSDYPYYNLFTDTNYTGESRFTMTKLATPEEIIEKQELGKEAYDVEQIINLYDGCVRQFDDEVKNIVQHLDDCGLKDDTIIVIYSDHGTDFFETGSWGQGNTLFGDDPSGRIPLIIVDPRHKGGQVIDQTTRTIDFVPTLLDLLGIKSNTELDGVSLMPLFEKPEKPMNLPAFQETGLWLGKIPGMYPDHLHYPNLVELLDIHNKESGVIHLKDEFHNLIIHAKDRSIRTDNWKLIYIPTSKGIVYQLFDVRLDPECEKDVSDHNQTIFLELKDKLDTWIAADPLMTQSLQE